MDDEGAPTTKSATAADDGGVGPEEASSEDTLDRPPLDELAGVGGLGEQLRLAQERPHLLHGDFVGSVQKSTKAVDHGMLIYCVHVF